MAILALVGAALSLYIPSLFTAIPGCRPMSLGAFAATPDVAMQRFACGVGELTVAVQAFPSRSNPARVITAQRGTEPPTIAYRKLDDGVLLDLLADATDAATFKRILVDNPAQLYDF